MSSPIGTLYQQKPGSPESCACGDDSLCQECNCNHGAVALFPPQLDHTDLKVGRCPNVDQNAFHRDGERKTCWKVESSPEQVDSPVSTASTDSFTTDSHPCTQCQSTISELQHELRKFKKNHQGCESNRLEWEVASSQHKEEIERRKQWEHEVEVKQRQTDRQRVMFAQSTIVRESDLIASLKSQVAELKREKKAWEEERKVFKMMQEDAQIVNQVAHMSQEELEKSQSLSQELMDDVDNQQEKLREAEMFVSELQTVQKQLWAQLEASLAEGEMQRDRCDRWEAENQELRATVAECQEECADLDRMVKVREDRLTEHQDTLQEFMRKQLNMTTTIESLHFTIGECKKDLLSRDRSLANQDSLIAKLKADKAKAEKHCNRLTQVHKETVFEAQVAERDALTCIHELFNNTRTLMETQEALENNLQQVAVERRGFYEIHQRSQYLQNEAEAGMEARQKLAVAEHNMSVMHHHLQEAKLSVQAMENGVEEQIKRISKKAEVKSLQNLTHINDLRSSLVEEKRINGNLLKQLAALEDALRKQEKETKRIQNRVKRIREENIQLKQSLQA